MRRALAIMLCVCLIGVTQAQAIKCAACLEGKHQVSSPRNFASCNGSFGSLSGRAHSHDSTAEAAWHRCSRQSPVQALPGWVPVDAGAERLFVHRELSVTYGPGAVQGLHRTCDEPLWKVDLLLQNCTLRS